MISRLLVANRGEIAARVFRTCRRLGIETVAVHSDVDGGLSYVAAADHAVRLPGHTPAETYLDVDTVLAAAKSAGADAIHPGYGFLSENAAFARAVLDAGLTWIGPDPDSIEMMGSKVEAKKTMTYAGVPVLTAPDEPTEADLPLLVKASAGGGGRGMRIVRTLAELPTEIAAAEAEAASAFGDGTVFVEPYVEHGRHVEVQVVGDGAGGILVLGERDCSLQRRHQKVVEEAPAPAMEADARRSFHEAARDAASAIKYRGAGTVEFLFDPTRERFWFLEMNTRLQVEHPVTEWVHGVDLVELQLRVAEGGAVPGTSRAKEPLPSHSPYRAAGHAVEVRLYAEDPAAGYQPQSGLLTRFEFPDSDGVRVDAGFASGNEVSTHYDALLAKVVAYGESRPQAIRRLVAALRRARIHGVVTNREQLLGILTSEEFASGEVSTGLLAEREFTAGEPDPAAPVAATVALAETARARRRVQQGIPVAWRNVTSQPQRTRFRPVAGGDETTVEWYGTRDRYVLDGYTVVAAAADRVTLEAAGVRTTYAVAVAVAGDRVDVDSPAGHTALRKVPRFTDPADLVAAGSLLAPMPGTVVRVDVEVGQEVPAGAPVLVLEAMKMQHTVTAPTDGVVTEIHSEEGTQVAAGQVLAVVEQDDEGAEA